MKKDIYVCDRCGSERCIVKQINNEDLCPSCHTWASRSSDEKIEELKRRIEYLELKVTKQ